jgi:hypothetical protein
MVNVILRQALRIQAPNGGIDALRELGLVHECGWNVHEPIISRLTNFGYPLTFSNGVETTWPRNALCRAVEDHVDSSCLTPQRLTGRPGYDPKGNSNWPTTAHWKNA